MNVVITVSPKKNFSVVVEALKAKGLTVESEQPVLFTMIGSIEEEKVPSLREVDGVTFVRSEMNFTLAKEH